MPYATNDGVRIYYETEGSGPPLLLHHGFTDSLDGWRTNGYVAALAGDYALLLIDARAHGRSDKPRDPVAHKYAVRVADVIAVLDHTGVERAHYWGYSMGGRIGWAIANAVPARLRSLIIGGAHPYPVNRVQWQQMADTLLAEAEQQATTATAGDCTSIADRDAASLAASALATRDFAEVTENLMEFGAPALIYCGDGDPAYEPARRATQLLPHAEFVTLPGLDHAQGWQQGAVVVPQVRAFLASL